MRVQPIRGGLALITASLCLALTGSACSKSSYPDAHGRIVMRVNPLASPATALRAEVEVQPANILQGLAYNGSDGTFSGTLSVPAGEQTITVRAYDGVRLVGTGAATATIVAGTTTAILIKILDATGPRRGRITALSSPASSYRTSGC